MKSTAQRESLPLFCKRKAPRLRGDHSNIARGLLSLINAPGNDIDTEVLLRDDLIHLVCKRGDGIPWFKIAGGFQH